MAPRYRALHAVLRLLPTARTVRSRGFSTLPEPVVRMEYQDAIRTLNTLQTNASYLEHVKRQRSDPVEQLKAMRLFLERSGLRVEDLDQLNIIHVTGTKGKGSTCAFTEQILRNCGLKTGFYSSPHLVQVRERIRINGQPISKELFSKYFWQVYNRLEETKEHEDSPMPAYFRFLTIMAFHVFLQEKVDLAVLEVGIGGAFDCTNIIRKPVVCGIASLGIDHTSILGDTIEKIAWQKGGIFKPGVPAFTVPQLAGPLEVLKSRAQEIGCPLYMCPDFAEYEDDSLSIQLGLAGEHQRVNATLALQLSHTWLQRRGFQGIGEHKSPKQIPSVKWPFPLAPVFRPSVPMVEGLQNTVWLGRSQILQRGPISYYIDGAHTNSSVKACVRWFHQVALNEERAGMGAVIRVLVFNATGERDTAALMKLLQPCHFDYALFCPNISEVSGVDIADQQNYNVTLENILTRCLENQKKWNRLMEERSCSDHWGSSLPVDALIKESPRGAPLLFRPSSERLLNCNSLVFPCISHALQWATQGRDQDLPCPDINLLHHQPVASSGSVLLREAARVQILITGSLHLVGGALKVLDQSLSQ
ncbi:folylpolyglutamate synthase, mitochondrial isoform X1 [Pelobates cultripes]|uniref:Folylpolyglutamate synthase n=1 Tax=Pelobates cultripes TaxID=61616 RepID=A0AAD1T3S5_PELCU|nr:folylpolyglutamate synthase, mitochondrial isoform X1 [Pelobates cultripes]